MNANRSASARAAASMAAIACRSQHRAAARTRTIMVAGPWLAAVFRQPLLDGNGCRLAS
jgi:hypothetical protein